MYPYKYVHISTSGHIQLNRSEFDKGKENHVFSIDPMHNILIKLNMHWFRINKSCTITKALLKFSIHQFSY